MVTFVSDLTLEGKEYVISCDTGEITYLQGDRKPDYLVHYTEEHEPYFENLVDGGVSFDRPSEYKFRVQFDEKFAKYWEHFASGMLCVSCVVCVAKLPCPRAHEVVHVRG